jgi:hypothetical protein
VGSAVPDREITEEAVKPVPLTTRVISAEPTGTSVGLTPVMLKVAAGVPVLPPEPLEDELLPPPQPERIVTQADKAKAARRREKDFGEIIE